MSREWAIPFAVGFALWAMVVAVVKATGLGDDALSIGLFSVIAVGVLLHEHLHDARNGAE